MLLTRRGLLTLPIAAAIQRRDARMLGVVPFEGSPAIPLGALIGRGLDARLFTDLSTLDSGRTITPTEQFFIRTESPTGLPDADRWTIEMSGIGLRPASVAATDLRKRARAMGTFLLECAGNSNPRDFGLMSVAGWAGVPISVVLADAGVATGSPRGVRILVTGIDHAEASSTSVAGASWIFAPRDLDRAFLATAMNDAPLMPHHGAPLRLIVPRWYGCSCIKWVTSIELVPDDVAATPQMIEFANRTHQPLAAGSPPRLRGGVPAARLAREFTPATLEVAAMPVRVEKWLENDKLRYRVIGIVWGGSRPTNALQIRFDARETWLPVENCPLPPTTDTWSLWTHTWTPQRTGRFQIVLRVSDPSIAARRLDLYFYTREVRIDEI